MKLAYQSTILTNRLNYIIEKCLLAVAFFLPVSLGATTAFMAAGAFLWIGRMVVNRRMDLRRTPFDLAIVLLVVLSAASVFVSPDFGFSYYNYYHLMGRYILLYYLVVNNVHSTAQIKSLVFSLLASAAFVAAYGFYQYLHGVDMAVVWVDGEQFPGLKVRVFSTLQNPNLLAGFLVIIMALAGGLGLGSRRASAKMVYFGLILALGLCLVLTYSRGAWISVLAVIITFGLLYDKRLLWLLAIIPVAIAAGHDVLLNRLMSIMNPTDTSSTLRLALWESTLAMIKDHPFGGIGWGAYWLVYPRYDFFMQNADAKIFHAHNMYLNFAAEIGLPGLAAFLAVFYRHARKALALVGSCFDRWLSGLMLGVFAALVGIAVSGFTDYVLFNIQLSMLFWFLIALVVCVNNNACGKADFYNCY